jgi:hypothetical protein
MTVITMVSAMALVTPMNVGIKLYKKSSFAFNGEIDHHASFKVVASTLIESIATFEYQSGAVFFD